MASRATSIASLTLLGTLLVGVVGLASAGGGSPNRTTVTVWAAAPAVSVGYGGISYGGAAPTSGGMITEQREIDVGVTGEVRVAGVAATLDAASVQLRDLTDPAATIVEQRFVPAASTPSELLGRHVGDTITVVTAKGELTGALRSVDEQALVIEVGTGDQRRLQIMRRDSYVHDVRLPTGHGTDLASLVWRLASRKPGKHLVELSYRAEGLSWSADYLAVLDETGTAVDFSAWATIRNTTGATFAGANVILVAAPGATPNRHAIATPVQLVAGQSVQVELMPPRRRAKVRSVVAYEAMPDPALGFQAYPNTDCTQFNGLGNGRAEIAAEVEVPTKVALPEGRIRTFRRHADRLEVVGKDLLRTSEGLARIPLAPAPEIAGERRVISCTYDERAHTVLEKIEVKVENKSRRAAEVVIREFAWRWPAWKLEAEDTKSKRTGAQTLEYRAHVPAGGKRTVTYSVSYTW